MHNLRLQNLEEGKTSSSQTHSSQIDKERKSGLFTSPESSLSELLLSENLFLSDLAECSSTKLHCWTDDFFGLFVDGFSLYGFSADAFGKESAFYADGVAAVCNVAHLFSPAAPHAVSAVDVGVLCAFEGLTGWRTRFDFIQFTHDL